MIFQETLCIVTTEKNTEVMEDDLGHNSVIS